MSLVKNVCLVELRKKTVVFRILCGLLMLFLLYEEIKEFLRKPINTTMKRRPLVGKDIPSILLCAEPAFKIRELMLNGYEV